MNNNNKKKLVIKKIQKNLGPYIRIVSVVHEPLKMPKVYPINFFFAIL